MPCPPEIASILLNMLRFGLLLIRETAWDGNSKRCFIESDHLHNIPSLLQDYSPDRLLYYWEAERVDYIKLSPPEAITFWQENWNNLSAHVDSEKCQLQNE